MSPGRLAAESKLLTILLRHQIFNCVVQHRLKQTYKSHKNKIELFLFFKKGFYVFIFREREKERKRNINVREQHWLVASCTHSQRGQNWQPRHLLQPGTELVTFHLAGWYPTNWAAQFRAKIELFLKNLMAGHWKRLILFLFNLILK